MKIWVCILFLKPTRGAQHPVLSIYHPPPSASPRCDSSAPPPPSVPPSSRPWASSRPAPCGSSDAWGSPTACHQHSPHHQYLCHHPGTKCKTIGIAIYGFLVLFYLVCLVNSQFFFKWSESQVLQTPRISISLEIINLDLSIAIAEVQQHDLFISNHEIL